MVAAKSFQRATRQEQILYILERSDTPLNIWEIQKKFQRRSMSVTWKSIQSSLQQLRTKGKVGVVNYSVEEKKRKSSPNYYQDEGTSLGGTEELPRWSLLNNG